MTLAFLLSMPHAASWNGKWNGEGKCYAIVRKFKDETGQRLCNAEPYFYRWPDGWCAKVHVYQASPAEARRLRRVKEGFCGYDWMVDSIVLRGKILADHEVKEQETQQPA